LGIEQIGSTAVPGLDAKPILDLMVAVESIDEYEGYSVLLRRLGYEFRSLGNFARQALFSDGFSFSFMMPMYWLTRCLDSPVVRVMNSMSGMWS